METAHYWGEKALEKAAREKCRWWERLASLTLGKILAADEQLARGAQRITSALTVSKEKSFQLLQVDSLLAKAELDRQDGQFRECLSSAREALALAKRIGYGLRKPALEKLVKATARA